MQHVGNRPELRAIETPKEPRMKVVSNRFGTLEVDEADIVQFPAGIIGFPRETRFLVVPHSEVIAFLQSVTTPELAFPLVSVHVLGEDYPDVPLLPIAEQAGLGDNLADISVLAVLCAQKGQPATVNLLAPVIVNVATRVGAQVFLEGSRYTTRELFFMRQREDAPSATGSLDKAAAG